MVDITKNRIARLSKDLGDSHLGYMLSLPFTLPFTLRRFFGSPLDPADAPTLLTQALQTRERRFLELAQTHVYSESNSPYVTLLRHAGCTFDDLKLSLMRDGLDETLSMLAGAGVYLTPDEFKGKTDVVRGSLSFRVQLQALAPRRKVQAITPRSLLYKWNVSVLDLTRGF